ncbi:MAG: MBL fold metallo-hydrolase [Eubacteriaceae bacterium]|nr:MBL fold metallo-hydrolase [Eubacteriaceae bacterium]
MRELTTTTVAYGDGIFAIDQQMVRAFLVVGNEKALLIDTGAMQTDIQGIIAGITDKPITVVLTHSDGDHTGNLQAFSEAFIHANDLESVKAKPEYQNATLNEVNAGDVFDLGGRRLKTLFIPGHTPGSIALLDEENKMIFPGDTVSYGPVYMFGAGRNINDYLDTLNYLRGFRDAGAFCSVYCAHGECPLDPSIIDTQIELTRGIMSGTIIGEETPMRGNTVVRLAKLGKTGILY